MRKSDGGRHRATCLSAAAEAVRSRKDLDSYLGARELPFEIRSRRVGSVEHVFIMAIAIILMVAVTLIAAKAVGILSMDPTL